MIARPFQFEDFILDPERRELRRGGARIAMGPQVFDLLLYLVRERQRVVSKDDMIATVWNGRIVSDSTLTSHVNAVRKALGDTGKDQRLVRTVPRKGLRFVGELKSPPEPAARPVAPAERAAPSAAAPSIAVLPFTNMGGDDQDYFADGITEDIIVALSKWRSLSVLARNSTFAFKGRSVDVRDLGRDLGVHYVLEGSVRRAGDRVRIAAQLVEAANGAHLWAERYDRELIDVFAVQEEISRRIAAVVEPELLRFQQARTSARSAAELEAWDCLHRGLYLLYRFEKQAIAAARPYFERAIVLDAGMTRAHASLAYSHQLDLVHGYSDDIARSAAKLLEHAQASVRCDETDGSAHVLLGYAYCRVGHYGQGVDALRRAVELNSNDSWALGSLGHALDLAGSPEEGRAWVVRAIELNPREPRAKFYFSLVARICINMGDFAAAEGWARKAIGADASEPRGHMMLASALGHLGRREEARSAADVAERARKGYLAVWQSWAGTNDPARARTVAEGLRKAGLRVALA